MPHEPTSACTAPAAVRFRLNIGFALFFLLGFPALLGLGNWQLQRAGEKRQQLAAFEARRELPPIALAALAGVPREELHRRAVRLEGEFLPGRDFLLDNAVHDGSVGYQLISPFREADGTIVMVNRGWLPAGRLRSELPAIPPPLPRGILIAEVYIPPAGSAKTLQAVEGWPSVIQAVDPVAMAARLGAHVHPFMLLARPGQAGVFPVDWPVVNMSPERHTAYATTWFGLAAVLVVTFVFGGTNALEWLRDRRGGRR